MPGYSPRILSTLIHLILTTAQQMGTVMIFIGKMLEHRHREVE